MQPEVEDPRHARYGLMLFAVYVALYAGFILLAVFNTPLMGKQVFLGLNLAIAYGFGLIAAALVLALVYMWLCGEEHPPCPPSKGEDDPSDSKRTPKAANAYIALGDAFPPLKGGRGDVLGGGGDGVPPLKGGRGDVASGGGIR